ncbi:MAG: hypothetical protein WCK62_05070 [Actinomycetes bacterium]|jgi:hypothetical protein
MALCGECGNSVGAATKCPKCGSENLKNFDRNIFGIGNVPDRRTVEGDWDAAAAELLKTPSKESMKEVKRQARKRRRRRQPVYAEGSWGRSQSKIWVVVALVVVFAIATHGFIW